MERDQLLAFVALAVTVAVIPGPDMALVARNVLQYGRRAGFLTTLGICTGILGWALAAAAGVTAILATSAAAFTVLRLVGAAYLIYLGVSTFRTLRMANAAGETSETSEPRPALPTRQLWVQGLLSALLNPKLGVFFLTILPQFIETGSAGSLQAVRLVLLFDLIGLTWLLIYSWTLGVIGTALARPPARRILQRVTGLVLIGLGIRLALQRS